MTKPRELKSGAQALNEKAREFVVMPRPFLTRPIVVDWLQYGDFPDKLGEIDYPQVALSLIAEYKAEIKKRDARIEDLEKALAKMGDASTDVFDQMIKGSWADSEGHDVRLNVAMIYLKSAVVTAMELLWPLSKRDGEGEK